MNAAILPAARDDIIRQFRWYLVEQDAPDAAHRFLDAMETSVEQLLRRQTGCRSPPEEGIRQVRSACENDLCQ